MCFEMCFKLRYKFSFRVVIKEGLSNVIKVSFVCCVVLCCVVLCCVVVLWSKVV